MQVTLMLTQMDRGWGGDRVLNLGNASLPHITHSEQLAVFFNSCEQP